MSAALSNEKARPGLQSCRAVVLETPVKETPMNSPEDSTAAPEGQLPAETRDIGDAIDILVQAMSVNRVVWLAAPAYDGSASERDGMMFVIDHVDDLLKDVKSILYANIRQGSVQ